MKSREVTKRDVSAALAALEGERVLREVVGAGEAERFEATLVRDREADEVLEEILEAWFAGEPSTEDDDAAAIAHVGEIS